MEGRKQHTPPSSRGTAHLDRAVSDDGPATDPTPDGLEPGADPAAVGFWNWLARRAKAVLGVPLGAAIAWAFTELGLEDLLGADLSDEVQAAIVVAIVGLVVERIRNRGT